MRVVGSGAPMSSDSVGKTSVDDTAAADWEFSSTTPFHDTKAGSRMPPSQVEPLPTFQ